MKNNKFRWGIIGCGKIAEKFTESLAVIPEAELYGVASKSAFRAKRLAEKFGVPHYYTSYHDLVASDKVDAIYIATTHNFHYENAMLCIDAGKAVLCEKPLTVNAVEAGKLIHAAREKNIFLMEAFWTRFLPSTSKLMSILKRGTIGDVRLIKADFGYDFPFDPKSRVYDPGLAGGALLDVGIYPINFAQMIYRSDPAEIQSLASIGSSGIDEQSTYSFKYANGAMALLHAAVNLETRHDAWIYGTRGYIHVPRFYCASRLHMSLNTGRVKTYESPFLSTGYSYEAEEVIRCMAQERIESEIMPLDESLKIMKMMDDMRKKWKMQYPNDEIASPA